MGLGALKFAVLDPQLAGAGQDCILDRAHGGRINRATIGRQRYLQRAGIKRRVLHTSALFSEK